MPVIETISKESLKNKMDRGEDIQIVNVSSPLVYETGSIKNSLKIPLDDLEKRVRELDRKKEIIAYCTGPECSASMNAAWKLMAKDFRVQVYKGGIREWRDAGLPIE